MKKNNTLRELFVAATPFIATALKNVGYDDSKTSEIVINLATNIHVKKRYSTLVIEELENIITGRLKVSAFIHGIFTWSETPEGHSYWGDIYYTLRKSEL